MSEQQFWSVVGLFALIVGGIAGALWKHVVEDAKVRERLATLEADSETTKDEVRGLRERLHDLRAELAKVIAEWTLRLFGRRNKDE